MIELPYAIALSLAGALLGGAVSWGALRSTVTTLRELVEKVETKVEALSKLELTITRVDAEVSHHKALLEALGRWRDTLSANLHTGRHDAAKG